MDQRKVMLYIIKRMLNTKIFRILNILLSDLFSQLVFYELYSALLIENY